MNRFNGIFIRAPGIVSIDEREQVKVLATLTNNSGNTQKPSFVNSTRKKLSSMINYAEISH